MYLITLARFVNNKEKKAIIKELKAKKDKYRGKCLIVEKPVFKHYVANIVEMKEEFKVKTLSQLIDKLKKYKIKDIKVKLHENVPFHKKAIVDRFLRKNKFNEKGKILYLEAIGKNPTTIRIGFFLEQQKKEKKYYDLAIEAPKTVGEISDFVRLSKVFGNKIYIITLNDKKTKQAIKAFLRENSFDKANVKVIKDYTSLKDYVFVGFSLWGKHSLRNLKKENYLLIFGNEERGLTKNTLDKCKFVVKIGNKSSEPLRATQAAAFALGYLSK